VHPTLIYDGECGFCTTSAAWVSKRWPEGEGARAVPWQHLSNDELDAMALGPDELARAAWWVEGDRHDEGARAVARALLATEGPWAIVGKLLLLPPLVWLAPWGYRVVARFRHRLPGGTPACKL
jgi:predicted DCC family thiol-disulfide oxidoreductase YuxK